MKISDYITICHLKNGGYRLGFTLENQANICKKLFELGFRRSKIHQKRIVLFKQDGLELIPVDINDLQRAFLDYLNQLNSLSFPEDISKSEILSYYFDKMPVRRNGLLFHHLNYEISERESHQLLLKLDFKYKHRFEINQLLKQLDKWGFTQIVDAGSLIATNEPLYFKEIGGNQYLIFSHYNAKSKKWTDGFDCWITTFKNSSDIGKKKPLQIDDIQLSFHLDRDLPLLAQYIEIN